MTKSGQPRQGRWALQDAKNKLSEVVNAAERGEPQIVTRRGVETAVIISHEEFERATGGRASAHGSLAACLLAMPTSELASAFDRIDLPPRDLGA
jgi:prevent-host-death family protein